MNSQGRVFKFFRTLRFQVAALFLVLLTAVLALSGLIATKTLSAVLESQSEDQLNGQLGALKGWFTFDDSGQPFWDEVDHSDPEEESELARLQAVYLVANDRGDVVRASTEPTLKQLWSRQTILDELAQIEKTRKPVLKTIRGEDKLPYQVLASTMVDNKRHKRWYVAEGRSLAEDRRVLRDFKAKFLIIFPLAIAICVFVSWYSAGRALRRLKAVEKGAEQITGSNLGLQLPTRGADDELDRLIGTFNEMSRRLKASFDQMRQFSTDVSHELRTPLTAIQGQLEVALFTASTKEQLQESIENALQDVERLANLVRALLLLSQSESGQIPLRRTTLDLCQLVAELVDQYQIPAEAAQISLTNECHEAIACEVDRTQMERVVTNLLSNAIKYTPPEGWVRTSVVRQHRGVKLVVQDSGVGIPSNHIAHIFDRFYRVPDPNPEKGLGLGLSFVAAIVKAHGGEIRVTSKPGEGSRFEVMLPGALMRQNLEQQPALQG